MTTTAHEWTKHGVYAAAASFSANVTSWCNDTKFLLPLICIWTSYLSHSDCLVVFLSFYTVPMFIHAVRNHFQANTCQHFNRENMTSFFKYITSTLRVFLRRAAIIVIGNGAHILQIHVLRHILNICLNAALLVFMKLHIIEKWVLRILQKADSGRAIINRGDSLISKKSPSEKFRLNCHTDMLPACQLSKDMWQAVLLFASIWQQMFCAFKASYGLRHSGTSYWHNPCYYR